MTARYLQKHGGEHGEVSPERPQKALLAALLLILAGYFWYTRPMTLEQICPDLPLDQVTGVSGWYRTPDHELQQFSLDDVQMEALLTLVKDQTFRRSLSNLLPQRGNGFRTAAGDDFTWTVNFEFQGEPLIDPKGYSHTGILLQLHDFWGEDVTIRDDLAQKDWRAHSPGFSQWRQDVFSILTEGENKT